MKWRTLYRSWEYQKRGLLHVHVVAPMHTPAHREATGRYVEELWHEARWHGFGYVMGGSRRDRPGWVKPPRVAMADSKRAAGYVAKYLSSIGSGKDSMRTVAARTAKRGSVLYVAPGLMRESGCSMRTLRASRRVTGRYPWAQDSRGSWRAACALSGLREGRPPLRPEDEERLKHALLTSRSWGVWNARTGEVVRPTEAAMPRHLKLEHGPDAPPRASVRVALASVRHRVPTPAIWGPPTTVVTALEVK